MTVPISTRADNESYARQDLDFVGVNAVSAAESVKESGKRPWLFNASFDLLFCCGGLLWILVALHSFIVPRTHRGAVFFSAEASAAESVLGLLLMSSAYMFIYPHHAATWLRLYPNKQVISKYWFCALLIPVVICSLLAVIVQQPSLLSWAVRLNGIVTMQHWVAQCYGIGMIYFARAGFPLTKIDRNLIWYSCQLLIALASLRFLSLPLAQMNLSMGMKIEPIIFVSPEIAAGMEGGIFAVSGVLLLILAARWFRARLMPPLAVLALFLTIYRIGLNAADSCVDLLFYGLPFFHSLQYLLVSSHFYAREKQILGKHQSFNWNTMFGSKQMQKYFISLALLGGVVYTAAPYLLQQSGIPYATALVLAFISFNIHHIISDAFIWRLREPSVREKF